MTIVYFNPHRSRNARKGKLILAIAKSTGLSAMHSAVHELAEAVLLDREQTCNYYYDFGRVIPIRP